MKRASQQLTSPRKTSLYLFMPPTEKHFRLKKNKNLMRKEKQKGKTQKSKKKNQRNIELETFKARKSLLNNNHNFLIYISTYF